MAAYSGTPPGSSAISFRRSSVHLVDLLHKIGIRRWAVLGDILLDPLLDGFAFVFAEVFRPACLIEDFVVGAWLLVQRDIPNPTLTTEYIRQGVVQLII